MKQLEFEGLTRVSDIEEQLNLTRGALNYRIKKNGFEKVYKFTGQGTNAAFVSNDDAQILMMPMFRDLSDYVTAKDLSEEILTTVHIVGRAATELSIKSVKGRIEKGGFIYTMYSPEDATEIRRYFKMRGSGEYLYSSTTNNNDTLNDNRRRSLYHRLTPYGGLLEWEK